MRLAGKVFDVWAFQRRPDGVVFLLLHTSAEKAARSATSGCMPGRSGRRSTRMSFTTGASRRCRSLWCSLRKFSNLKSPARELCFYAAERG